MIDDYDDYDDFGDRYDTANAYDSPADREPTPALLAAKAEPLAGSPSAARRAGRKPAKSGRTKAGEAARASKARSKRKPKEPSKLWLAAGIAAILLAGFGTAYFLTQRGGDDSVADGDAVETLTDGESTATSAEGSGDAAVDTTVAVETTVATGGPPVVIFDDAAVGPIESAVPYTLAIGQGPADAMYQLLVDNEPQAEPALELPPVTFAPGRHLLVVNITSPQGDISTDPVLVYALAPTPEATWRANLSSVDVANEGWAEAVRQYEDYVATGHAGLQLMPSDRFPELTSGYWNLFVGGFPDNASAAAYCEEYGLSVPDQCFPTYADPNAAAGG